MSVVRRRAVTWGAAAAAIALVTVAGRVAGLNATAVGFVYLIVVLLVSVWGDLLVGTVSAVVAALCYNFFFFAPLYTFTIAEPANWFALAAFLISSVTVNRLVVAARTLAQKAEERRNEIEALYALSVDLFAATNRIGALGEAAGRALQLLGARGGGLVLFGGSTYNQTVVSWNGEKPDEIEDLIAGVGRHQEPLELPSPLGRDVYLPLFVGGRTTGVLVARGTTSSKKALQSAARLVALAVEREHFIEQNAHMQALRESEALKTSLLRAISHDLTTPITAVSIRTESLRRRAGDDRDLRDDVDAIAAETSRLRRRIDNLLAMARLEAGKAKPRREPTPPADLFRAARENLPLVLAARPVPVHVDADCPDADVDPSLALEILVNLLENAHRVSPAGAPVELVARRHPLDAGKLRIEVLDRGPGVPPGVTDPSGQIAENPDVAQRGLGLEIARSLAAANGGSIGLAPRPGGGTVARIDFPAALLAVGEEA
jgi:two-component system, OmpR family, sensor histidine kinase KdpD